MPTSTTNTRNYRESLAAAFGVWASDLASRGFTADLLTFLFHPLPGSEAGVHAVMLGEVARVYKTFITRLVRKPTVQSRSGHLPIWFCAPDYPVFKRTRLRLIEGVVNGGAHVHAIAFTPTYTRLRGEKVVDHFERRRGVYVWEGRALRTIDVEPITHCLTKVVCYAQKGITSGRVKHDDLLILPRTTHELSSDGLGRRSLIADCGPERHPADRAGQTHDRIGQATVQRAIERSPSATSGKGGLRTRTGP